jgi:triosephosphate isomerase
MAQVANFTTLARSLGHAGHILYAYEPYWAIGAAEAAPPEYVTAVAGLVRDRLDPDDGNLLIYGGTAGPGLLPEVYPAVGGLFLGRNSHDVGNVVTVVDEASRLP